MYVSKIRRELHMHPELGYDLPYTLGVVKRELEKFSIPYTEKYGKSGIVATINEGAPGKALAIRADMDALPIQEANDVPYKSLYEGRMHACGHDAHTAILLDTARKLTSLSVALTRPVKLIFQPAEEGGGGAGRMVQDGCMDDVDEIVAIHVNIQPACTVSFMTGPCNSAASSVTIRFTGKSAHAAMQSSGSDAIMMAAHSLIAIESYLAKRFPSGSHILFNAGTIHGGTAANIIADECTIKCTIRTRENQDLEKFLDGIQTIVKNTAEIFGGTGEAKINGITPVLVHDPIVTEHLRKAAEEVLGKENVFEMQRVAASEDFSVFAQKAPATMMRLGCGNAEKGFVHPVHTPHFDIDESALDKGSDIYVRYLLNRMGIG